MTIASDDIDTESKCFASQPLTWEEKREIANVHMLVQVEEARGQALAAQMVEKAIAQSRLDALEEAAKLCESLCCGDTQTCPEPSCEYRQCAAAIRAMAKEGGR